MTKAILAAFSAVALFGVAACSDTDETTTQSVNPPLEQSAPSPMEPAPMEPVPAPEVAPSGPAPMEPAPATPVE